VGLEIDVTWIEGFVMWIDSVVLNAGVCDAAREVSFRRLWYRVCISLMSCTTRYHTLLVFVKAVQ